MKQLTEGPQLASSANAAVGGADAFVEAVVREINVVCRAATFDFSNAIGKLIVDRFYGGELGSWRARGRKDASFRRLAQHPNLPMSAAALYRCVAIYEMCDRLDLLAIRHLSTSHLRAVLPLSNAEQQRLLGVADDNRWTVRRLSSEVASVRQVEPMSIRKSAAQRSRRSVMKALRVLELSIEDNQSAIGGEEGAAPISPEDANAMIDHLRTIIDGCAKFERRLRPLLQGARTEPPPPMISSIAEGRR